MTTTLKIKRVHHDAIMPKHATAGACCTRDVDVRRKQEYIDKAIALLTTGPGLAPSVTPNLEGLKDRLLAPRWPLTRNEDGALYHPDMPVFDEGTDYAGFLKAFGLECCFTTLESEDSDKSEAYHEGRMTLAEWTPAYPAHEEGTQPFTLLEVFDTEDGPMATFIRPMQAAPRRRRTAAENKA